MGAPKLNRMLLGPGDRVGRYEIVAEVAQGGMATVYVARLTSIGGFDKLFALKVLLPHLRSERAFVNMLLDEARIAASIHHPNVVQVLDIAEHEGTPYIAMELLRGRSLARLYSQARAKGAALTPGLVLGICARVAEGLHAAHEARDESGQPLGVVHRDVSPQNVHVSYDGHVKVVDFGIAAAAGRLTETTHGEVKGKVAYMAPEQLNRKRELDRRTDVWALGVLSFELLTGRRLFKGEDFNTTMWNILNREIPSVRDLAPAVPRPVAAVIAAALDRKADARPTGCDELMRVFDAAARELGGGTKEDVAALMDKLFAPERAVEEERIAAALRDGPPPPFEESDGEISETLAATRVERPPRRGRWPFYALSAVAIIGAAVAVVAATGALEAEPAEPSEPVAAETPPPSQESEPVSLALTTVEVDERARLVLVDGERRDERPLRLEVPEMGSVTVELVAPDGELHRHEVSAEYDGERLNLPRARRRNRRPPGARHRMAEPSAEMSMAPSRELVRDVF